MRTLVKVKHVLMFVSLCTVLYSCSHIEDNIFPTNDQETPVEPEKHVDGTWQIIKVVRNGQEITEDFDFSGFKINFLPDHTYTMENYVPFIVKKGGKWSLDDPRYPFNITFEQQGGEALKTTFNYPIVNGERQINLTFSPGCGENSYVYTMQRISK